MGAYLSEPNTTKESCDDQNDFISYGASSMQGWRLSQEDDHNAIIDYDTNTALFAVYDGHGGAEVAHYCSKHLPDTLKKLEEYQKEDLEEALRKGFIKFDEALLNEAALKELKELAGTNSDEDDTETKHAGDEDGEDVESKGENGENKEKKSEVEDLYDEATMPLEEVLKRYSKTKKRVESQLNANRAKLGLPPVESADKDAEDSGEAGGAAESSPSKKKKEGPDSKGDNDEAVEKVSKKESMKIDMNALKRFALEKFGLETKDDEETDDEEDDDDEDDEDDDEDYEDEDDDEEDGEAGEDDDEDDDEDLDEEDENDDDTAGPQTALFGDGEPGFDSGCTAVLALVRKNKLYVANAGDSRCVVSRAGRAVDMSIDHKPEDEDERARIEKAGGKVTADGRVNGGLNLSRAIGDHTYKANKDLKLEQQMITAYPDIKTLDLNENDDFMVLACDGIWNFMSSQDVVDYVKERLFIYPKISQICEDLFMHCLAPNSCGDGTGCDNMTCIIVTFKPYKLNLPIKLATPNKLDNQIEPQTNANNDNEQEKTANLKRTLNSDENNENDENSVNDDKSCKKIKVADSLQDNTSSNEQEQSIKAQ